MVPNNNNNKNNNNLLNKGDHVLPTLYNGHIDTIEQQQHHMNIICNNNNNNNIKELQQLPKIYNNTIIYRSTNQHKHIKPLYDHYSKVSCSTKSIFTFDQFYPKIDIDNNNLIVFAKGLEPLIQDNFEFYIEELKNLLDSIKKYIENKNNNISTGSNNSGSSDGIGSSNNGPGTGGGSGVCDTINLKLLLLTLNSQTSSYLNASLTGVIKYFNSTNTNCSIQCIAIDLDGTAYNNNFIWNTIENVISSTTSANSNSIFSIKNNNQISVVQQHNNAISTNNNNEQFKGPFGKTVLVIGQKNISVQFIKMLINDNNNIKDIIVFSKSIMNTEIQSLIGQCNIISGGGSGSSGIRVHFKHVDISKIYSIRFALLDIYNGSGDSNLINPVESIINFASLSCNLKKLHSNRSHGAINLHTISNEMNWNLKSFVIYCNGSTSGSIGDITSNEILESITNYRNSIGLSSNLIKL